MVAKLYVFDAYGTLFDTNSAVQRLEGEIGQGAEQLSQLWRVKQLEYTWTYTLAGRWRGFRDLTADALATASASVPIDHSLRDKLLAAYEELLPYPDVAPVLKQLRAQGAKTAILSNGSNAMLERLVGAADLQSQFDALLSAEEVKAYKPLPAIYTLVARRFGTDPAEVMFLSSNRWDIAGAHSFGFKTTWVNRTGKPDEYGDLKPDHVVETLDAVLAQA